MGHSSLLEQSEHTFINYICGVIQAQFLEPQNIYNNNIEDHGSHITITNRIMKSLKYCNNYQNMTQNKCC